MERRLRILVYEYVSGGGLAEKPISPSILSEGFGMLRTLSADFHAAGHSVTVCLDSRISKFQPPLEADRILPISYSNQNLEIVKNAARSVDTSYIIAPESNGILERIVSELENDSSRLMNSQKEGISAVCYKDSLLENARNIGLSTPISLTLNAGDNISETARDIANEIGFPAIIKPLSDAGMSGLTLVKEKTELPEAIKKAAQESGNERLMAQEFVDGVPASVSLISTGEQAVAISLNKQNVLLSASNSPSIYEGGQVPLEHSFDEEARSAAKQLVESYEGLMGYLGVDLVISERGPIVIEVNPRLTTSYIVLREVTEYNPAQAILEATMQNKLPAEEPSHGYACFSKVETRVLSAGALKRIYQLNELVSPPFPLSASPPAFGLMCSNGSTPQEAAAMLEKAKNHLVNLSHLESTQN
jgi:hypothetical protein